MMDMYELNDRFWATRQYKDRWLALYKDLYYYVIPDRDAFNVKWNYNDQGKPVTQMVWDNTAVLAAYQRSNDLHGLLLPKDRIWGKLVMDPHINSPQDIQASAQLLEEMNERIFFYLNESNLPRVVSSSNLDLVGGTGAIWVESISDDEPLYFRSIPAVALYIEYSTDDVVNTCWYQCKMMGRMILKTFPDYNGNRKSALQELPDEMYIVVYGQIKISEHEFYMYAVMEDDPFTPLWEAQRAYNQIIIYRDRVRPGEADGRGVGIDLLPTIRDLNRIVAYDRQNLAFKANPPMFYDADSYFNPYSVRQWAGAMIARNSQGRNPLEALQMPIYPEVLPKVQHLQETIQRAFQVDPLGELQTPVRSATEISVREARAQRTSATDISRLINELPKQVYEVAAKILSERRLLTKNRGAFINAAKSKKLRFDYKSPLYDLQKQEDLNHFITNMQIKAQFYGPGAAVATTKLGIVNEFLTEKLNLPHNMFANEQELDQYIKSMTQAAQQGALPPPVGAAAPVSFPQNPGTTI